MHSRYSDQRETARNKVTLALTSISSGKLATYLTLFRIPQPCFLSRLRKIHRSFFSNYSSHRPREKALLNQLAHLLKRCSKIRELTLDIELVPHKSDVFTLLGLLGDTVVDKLVFMQLGFFAQEESRVYPKFDHLSRS